MSSSQSALDKISIVVNTSFDTRMNKLNDQLDNQFGLISGEIDRLSRVDDNSRETLREEIGKLRKDISDIKADQAKLSINVDQMNDKLTKMLPAARTNPGDEDLVKGLPSNVRMRETGPKKNMFTDDDFDIYCD